MLSRLAVRSGKLTVDDFVGFSQMSIICFEYTVHTAQNLLLQKFASHSCYLGSHIFGYRFFDFKEQDLLRTSSFAAMVPRCLAGARELATTPALAERDLVNFPPRQVFPFSLEIFDFIVFYFVRGQLRGDP